ncbi:von Willebrand factor A domain-containing protein 2 [Alligator mississippiensis]|uniref:von Willebrand factor A domain-containing protein 2 n=1 Tax=Alligator mississippiensis TaxID=8496 RepID=UPI0006ECBD6F|nr:von Willebrand factor A domain-containing protein 2 [Alligator mississippiensis]XP_059586114.1 von Willebrand factor A domain-containing protein 2 [Alligator mississippiensis]XP_059586116.1 von Willebrand factor A domain-containing protein 2 [Alligator mississippiensis]XP_059586117.1 von Willebrand factor A domain-containing protein 2 [Alligator mississippiensis]
MSLLLRLEFICIFLFCQGLLVQGIQELHANQETIVKISAAGQLMQCSAPVDILFLLDGSYSIGKGSFERSKHFASKLCDALDINSDRVRVGVIQFSSTPWLEFPLDSYLTKQEVKEKIKKIAFRGGNTETGLALKYILRKGFPGGRNSSIPEILIILSDGKSQGTIALPAKQVKERGITVFAVGVKFPRWEELHVLASEPTEQHVLFAEHVDDATNGLYSTLTSSTICSAVSPGCKIESHPCERKTLETVKELAGNYMCWKGSKRQNAVHVSLCPFYSWKRVLIKHPSRCYRTTCPDPCDSQPCQNGGTCVPEGLEKYHCICPVGFGGDAKCAPKLSLECSVDLLFLVDSSSGTSLEGFLRYKAFLKRFVQAVLSRDTPAKVGVAQYSNNVTVPIAMGAYEDVHGLVRSIDAMHFTGGETLTGRALRYIAQHGFKSASAFTDIRVELPRVVALFTDSESQDSVAEAAKHTRDQGVFLIGVGSEFLRAELDGITGSPKQTIVYSNPQDLFNKIPELQKTICSVDRPPGCQSQSLDLVFALAASTGVGKENFLRLRDFVSSSSLQFDINRDVTQIGLVVYGSRARTVFALDTHTTSTALLEAINNAPFVGGTASVGSALLRIHDDVMTVPKGARPGVSKAVLVITDGGGTEDAAVPAQQLRDNGVLVFVVGIGGVQRDVLLRITGSPHHLIHVPSYEELSNRTDFIIRRICEEAKSPVNLCKPNPCVNEGVCVLRNGSYRCECRGREGPHCESRILRGDSSRSLLRPRMQWNQSRGLQPYYRALRHARRHAHPQH